MRCPYCGGLNRDQSTFCVNCGRDMRIVPPHRPQQAVPPARPPYPPQGYPPQPQPQPQQPRPVAAPPQKSAQPQVKQPAPTARPAQTPAQASAHSGRRSAPSQPPVVPVKPVEPEPPVSFPPRTIGEYTALLESGAQTYTVLEDQMGHGRRKVVRIAYPACAHWQQAATLLKALKEQSDPGSSTTIIQGVLPWQQDSYSFTNGQLQFDRDVRLGAQEYNRYIIETGNGFADGSVRFVLNE